MKYTITIEETVTKDFEVEADGAEETYELAKQKYKSGEYILDPGEYQFRQITIMKPNNRNTEWRKL